MWLLPVAQPSESAEAERLQAQVNQLYEQGQYAEAIPIAQRVLALRQQFSGADTLEVAVALNNLAELYRVQGRYDEAEPYFQGAIAILRKVLPPGDPGLATALNNLALLYSGPRSVRGCRTDLSRGADYRSPGLAPQSSQPGP